MASEFLRERQELWSLWFSSLEVWNGQELQYDRIAWLKIKGVPLQLWDYRVFNDIGRKFGEVVHESVASEKDGGLDFEKVAILTVDGKKIDQCVDVFCHGLKFKVWVSEVDEDWSPDFLKQGINKPPGMEEDSDRAVIGDNPPANLNGPVSNSIDVEEGEIIGDGNDLANPPLPENHMEVDANEKSDDPLVNELSAAHPLHGGNQEACMSEGPKASVLPDVVYSENPMQASVNSVGPNNLSPRVCPSRKRPRLENSLYDGLDWGSRVDEWARENSKFEVYSSPKQMKDGVIVGLTGDFSAVTRAPVFNVACLHGSPPANLDSIPIPPAFTLNLATAPSGVGSSHCDTMPSDVVNSGPVMVDNGVETSNFVAEEVVGTVLFGAAIGIDLKDFGNVVEEAIRVEDVDGVDQ